MSLYMDEEDDDEDAEAALHIGSGEEPVTYVEAGWAAVGPQWTRRFRSRG